MELGSDLLNVFRRLSRSIQFQCQSNTQNKLSKIKSMGRQSKKMIKKNAYKFIFTLVTKIVAPHTNLTLFNVRRVAEVIRKSGKFASVCTNWIFDCIQAR